MPPDVSAAWNYELEKVRRELAAAPPYLRNNCYLWNRARCSFCSAARNYFIVRSRDYKGNKEFPELVSVSRRRTKGTDEEASEREGEGGRRA